MYNTFMITNFRNKYSFNFLACVGLIIFVILSFFLISLYIDSLTKDISGVGFPFFIIFWECFNLSLLALFIACFIYILELILDKKITNEKFLKSKTILCLQIFGITFFLLLVFLFGLLLVYAYFS